MGILSPIVLAAALLAAASVPSPAPNDRAFVAAALGARCKDGGGRAIGDAVGKGYVRQELLIVADRDLQVLGHVYASSDGNDYIDLRPSDPKERVHLMAPGDVPAGSMLRYCFSSTWTAPWGFTPRSGS